MPGRAYLFLGGSAYAGSGATITVVNGGSATNDGIVPITSDMPGDSFGASCSRAGDLDGDGYADFVIAVPAGPRLGFVAVRGRSDLDANPPTTSSQIVAVSLGSSVSVQTGEISAGYDLDGDGRPDVVLGDTSKVYVFGGSASELVSPTPIATFAPGATAATGLPVTILSNWKAGRSGESALPDVAIGRGPGPAVLVHY